MSISKTMPAEMKTLYKDFYGDKARLKGEWDLCSTQYKEAIQLATSKEGSVMDRMEIRKISDYWLRRRQAMERSVDADMLEYLNGK